MRRTLSIPGFVLSALLSIALASGCRAEEHAIKHVSGNVVVCTSSYSFVYDGDGESYIYSLPEDDAPIDPSTLSSLIYKTLRPFSTSSAGTLHSDISTVPSLSVLKQVRRVGSLLSERVCKASPDDDFAKFIRQFETWDWCSEQSAFDSMIKVLRKAASNKLNNAPELRAILLLILGEFYETGYADDNHKDVADHKSAMQVYNDLADKDSVTGAYRAIALYRQSNILFNVKSYEKAMAKLEKLVKEYKSCCSEWPFYDDARWMRIRILGLQGHDTILTLLDDCGNGDSSAVLASIAALHTETWMQVLNHATTTPIPAIELWVKSRKEGTAKEIANMVKQLTVDDVICSSNKVKRVWLWWLQKRHSFPPQRLPEDMRESELLRKFVEEIRKDPQLAKLHRDLLEKTLREAAVMYPTGKSGRDDK